MYPSVRGLWHTKAAYARGLANEHCGLGNKNDVFSMRRVNELLGRKQFSAGWGGKTAAPHKEVVELTVKIMLTANISDGFRIHCGCESLDEWVVSVTDADKLDAVVSTVYKNLFSRKRVQELRRRLDAERDRTLESVILFNADTLLLRAFNVSVKNGEIGRAMTILELWTLWFRGTRSMPKYSDAIFKTLYDLKRMDPKLR
jgi:hypothetical protein